MKHLAFLAIALVMALACTVRTETDTCSTGFLILWGSMFLAVEVAVMIAVELDRMTS